jgi:cytochrome c oxidase subunit 4
MSEEKEHLVSPAKYLAVLIALMVLLALTVIMAFIDLDDFARAHHLGEGWNTAIAIAIAVAKGLLILLIFMHLRYGKRLTWVFAAAGFIWLMIMLSLTMTDYMTRPYPHSATRQSNHVAPELPVPQ